ncbi:40S ribosomal protein S8-like [Mus musculus]|uniref:40S ribosomal protein S8-like n=1 Tax=Mus musculus TaxID=10090 RepID=UPI00167A5AF7|nr:40S ribosomal protein S8-like [Mus musculus]
MVQCGPFSIHWGLDAIQNVSVSLFSQEPRLSLYHHHPNLIFRRRSPRDPRISGPAGSVKWHQTWGTRYDHPPNNGLKRYHADSETVGESPTTSLECHGRTSESQRRALGIFQDNWHKRRKTWGKRKPYHKKRKYELGRPAANTKIGPRRIHTVRVRGGNKKYRALRLDVGNFSWGSECCTRKTRIIDVVYNASNNELVRTKTLVKNCIVLIDSTPYRQWYESHCALPLGRKKGAKLTPEEEEILNKKRSKKIQKKYDERKKNAKISSLLEEQFQQGKLLACIASRPGQCGRADGYVLEGKELEFYLWKIKARKGK